MEFIEIEKLRERVIELAYAEHRGCAPETCGGSNYDPCALSGALDALAHARGRAQGLDHAFQSSHTGQDSCVEAVPRPAGGVPYWIACSRSAAEHPAKDVTP